MITIAIAVVVVVALYLYGTSTFNYWSKRGVKHDKPIPFFGNNLNNYLMKKSISQMAVDIYWKYPEERMVGFYRTLKPELVIRDPELAKRILLNDFQYFYKRGFTFHDTVVEPLFRNLFFADGDLWKLLRQRMTPAFTSGKLKAMFPLIVERAERLQDRLFDASSKGRELDARDIMARYTTDFIGACGFGLDANSLNEEDSAFRKLGKEIFTVRFREIFRSMLKVMFTETFKNLTLLRKEIEQEIVSLVKEITKQRNHEPSGRNDFIDLLLECKKLGNLKGESIEHIRPDGTPEIVSLEMNDELMAAQVFIFFVAGFETSSSASSYLLHQLAYNPEVQKKVQEEIDRVLAKHNNKLSYDSIKEMTYLECAFHEGMRIFPSLGYLVRKCARKYTFPGTDITIDKDVKIYMPIQAWQTDPKYFDNPQEFRPERFLPDQFDQNLKHVYLPFGEGPRACIGARLGLMQSLAGLAAVLSRFSVEPSPNSVRIPEIDPTNSITQNIKGGLPLFFRERKVASS